MTEKRFYSVAEIDDQEVTLVVIFARYQGQWILSRHKKRNTWDFPGGHRECGESCDEAARRELWEETGALEAEIYPICVYSVTKNGETKNGMLYFAEIVKLGTLPEEFEMAERMLTDTLPKNLTYPDIYPDLFWKVQGWLNTRSNAGELWDIYDENRSLTGRLHRRGNPLQRGEYHLVVHVWVMNSNGEFLVTKRSPNKGFPNMWECTGGSALSGDDSLTAALREVREETGLILDQMKGVCLLSSRQSDYFRDVWLFRQDVSLDDIILQPGETIDKMHADKDQILKMLQEGTFVPYGYLEEFFCAAGL